MPVIAVGIAALVLVGIKPPVLTVDHPGSYVRVHEIGGHHHLTFDVRRAGGESHLRCPVDGGRQADRRVGDRRPCGGE